MKLVSQKSSSDLQLFQLLRSVVQELFFENSHHLDSNEHANSIGLAFKIFVSKFLPVLIPVHGHDIEDGNQWREIEENGQKNGGVLTAMLK